MPIIDNDLIPYAIHSDENTVVTKNGMALQTVCFKASINNHDEFRQEIRKFITENYLTDIVIYCHTIKLSNKNHNLTQPKGTIEHVILRKVSEICKFTAKNEISFNITFVTQIMPNNTSNIGIGISKVHNTYLKKATKKLNSITDKMLKSLSDYSPVKLGIVQKDGTYISQHMNFIGKILNFEDEDFEIPMGGLCYATNYSRHVFKDKKVCVKNPNQSYYANVFGLKEYSEISCDIVYRMLQGIENIIISQIIIPFNNQVALKDFQKINQIYSASNDEEFKSSSTLNYMNQLIESQGKANIYAKCQSNITVISVSQSKLSEEVSIISDIFAKTGIISFVEDVNLQNSFFSMIPGNVRFCARNSNIPISLFAGFSYSEGSDSVSNSNFMWKTTLTTFQRTNNRRYQFGMPIEQRNVMIIGRDGVGRRILSGIAMCGAVANEIPLIYIDTSNKGDAMAILLGLRVANITMNADVKSKIYSGYNPFYNTKVNKKSDKIIEVILKSMVSAGSIVSQEIITKMTQEIIFHGFENFETYVKSNKLQNEFRDWIGIGKYASIFQCSSKGIDIFNGKSGRFVIAKEVINDKKLIKTISMSILFSIYNIIKFNQKAMIIINDVFDIITDTTSAKLFNEILKNARNSANVSFIFVSQDSSVRLPSSPILEILKHHAEYKIFFGNDMIEKNDIYKDSLSLSKAEIEIISNLEKIYGRSFAIFTPYYKEYIKFNFANLNNDLKIISDGSGKALKFLESYISDLDAISFNREALYNMLSSNIDMDDQDEEGDENEGSVDIHVDVMEAA